MREPHAKELVLVYNKKVIDVNKCTLWADFDADTDFPGEGDLVMTAWPIGIPFGQGAVVPHDFDNLIASMGAADNRPQFFNGKPAPGVADALKVLKKNEFHSFYGTKNKFGMDKIISAKTSRRKRNNYVSTTTCWSKKRTLRTRQQMGGSMHGPS